MCSSLSHLKHFFVFFSFFFQHFLAIWPYLLQLKHFSFLSLKLLLDFPISIGCPLPLYVISIFVLYSYCSSMNLYLCLTEIITTFHSLSIFGAAMGRYPNMVLIMTCHIFVKFTNSGLSFFLFYFSFSFSFYFIFLFFYF